MKTLDSGKTYDLGRTGGRSEGHMFEDRDIRVIEAAQLTGRPILLKGDPGVGKSQMAKAAAVGLERGFMSKVVDHATEARELLWEEDLIERLAEAQAIGAGGRVVSEDLTDKQASAAEKSVQDRLDIRRFVRPGVLWWGFNPVSALKHCETFTNSDPNPPSYHENGMVVLIDEIDKAESDVPNGLLEALGSGRFEPRGYDEPVTTVMQPLVFITTNGERPLPPAFLRRCLVHDIRLPDGEALEKLFIKRATAHFPNLEDGELVHVAAAAKLVVDDRTKAKGIGLRPLPGQAEFVDLLNAMFATQEGHNRSVQQTLDELGSYIVRKHSELAE